MLDEQQLEQIQGTLLNILEGNTINGDELQKIQKLFSSLDNSEKKQVINAPDMDQEEYTQLHFAVVFGDLEVVKFFIENGADVNARDKNGETPLHLSFLFGKTEIRKLLLQHGANIDARDNSGSTSLHKSVLFNKIAETEFLIENGADINARDKAGETPLHLSFLFNKTEIRKLLLQHAKVSAPLMTPIKGHLTGFALVQHPEKEGVFYNENVSINLWEREKLLKESDKQVTQLRDNFFASSVCGFQIGISEINNGISPYLAKHLFPLGDQVFSPENAKQLAINTQVCRSWGDSVRKTLGGYLKDKITPEVIAKSGLSIIRQLPLFGDKEYSTRFQNGFREMLEEQKEENNREFEQPQKTSIRLK